MTVKSNMTKPDRKKRVKVNRVVDVVPELVPEPEVVAPDVVVLQPLELSVNISDQLDKLMDESSCVGDCEDPTSPVNSPKRKLRKPSEPKPMINEKGEYLNPRTNRYVKSGTSAYKQLVKDGIIVVLEN